MRRPAFTLVEQLIGLVLVALLVAIAFRGAASLRDGLAVHAGARAVRDALALAREQAVAGGTRVAVRFRRADGTLAVHAGADTLHRQSLAQAFGVSLEATRDSTAYLPSGLGVGGANLTVVLRRGTRADTVTVSRLGRVR